MIHLSYVKSLKKAYLRQKFNENFIFVFFGEFLS